MSHTFDASEHAKSGSLTRVLPSIRTLGSAVMSERVHISKFDDAYTSGVLDFGERMSTSGLDETAWGGAAGTKWSVDARADYLYSFQTNVTVSSGPTWLSEQISGIIQDHTY